MFRAPTKGKSQAQIEDGQAEKAISKFLVLLLYASSANHTKDGVYYAWRIGIKGEYTVLKSKVIHSIALSQSFDEIEEEERIFGRVVLNGIRLD